jgi:hypothetical protein
LILSIDYDDTYTRDPLGWELALRLLMQRGHKVWCVSARHQNHMVEAQESIGLLIGADHCVGTNGVAKRDYLFKVHGVYADVWIDDMPDTVTVGYDVGEVGLWVTQYDGRNTDL